MDYIIPFVFMFSSLVSLRIAWYNAKSQEPRAKSQEPSYNSAFNVKGVFLSHRLCAHLRRFPNDNPKTRRERGERFCRSLLFARAVFFKEIKWSPFTPPLYRRYAGEEVNTA